MAAEPIPPVERRKKNPKDEKRLRAGVSKPLPGGRFRSLGLGLITGASDDDPAAIGTYAAVGASLGPSFLWTIPALLPMMYATVYLCSKVGQVTGEGLFAVIRKHYPRWLLFSILACALIGNVIEAGADIGGMSAALHLLVPIPQWLLVLCIGLATAALQILGSYKTLKTVFRWLALVLLAYVAAAFLAKPNLSEVLRGASSRTFVSIRTLCPCWSQSWAPRSRRTCTVGNRMRKWKRTSRSAGAGSPTAWAAPSMNSSIRAWTWPRA